MGSPKLEWMYKGVSGLVEKEEYLTGRRIDKTFEIIQKEEGKKGDFDGIEGEIPGSIFAPTTSAGGSVTVDLATKLREDPLYEIRKEQQQQRKKLIENPVKMKRLKHLLELTLKSDRKKKRKHDETSSESSSSETSHSSSSSGSKRNQRDKYHKRYEELKSKSNRNYDRRHHYTSKHHRHHDDDKREHKYDSSYKRKNEKEKGKDFPEKKYSSYRSEDRKRVHNEGSSNKLNQRFEHPHHSRTTKKLSQEELEKKRQEMLSNAAWREEQRKSNVKNYKEEDEKEAKKNEGVKSAQFIKPLLKKAAESNSLEDRIKQRKFTSQRTQNAMESNFARR